MEEQETVQPDVKPTVKKTKNNNTFLVVLLIILFFIASGIVVYAVYQNNQLKKQIAQLKTQTNQNPSTPDQLTPSLSSEQLADSKPSPSPDPTENWKTYSNNELSFKYPSDWTVDKVHNNRIISSDSKIIINIANSDSTLMTECMELDNIEKEDQLVVKHFSRVTTGEMCSTNDPSPREKWIIPNQNSYSPGISYNYTTNENPEAKETFNQILSTFKFITNNWKTIKEITSTVENYLSGNPIIKEPELFYDNIYTVSYSYPNNPNGGFVLIGKINEEWTVAEGKLLCNWIKNSDADEATKAYMGPNCNF